ncbi:MAG: alanine racemase [Armatimonadetes bacterium]|nr:alanine racemase [Armatimonadota bacterium]
MAPYSRPNWAHIDLAALRHNARLVARHVAPARLIAVIKANAYGHGALEVARALGDESAVAMLAVASVDEAAQLRKGGIKAPILLLSAILPSEARDVVRLGLTATVFDLEVAAALNASAEIEKRRASVHFKVDSGMGRLGAHWCEAARVFSQICGFSNLEIAAIYTHFACADEDSDFSALQLRRFHQFCGESALPPTILKHAANSAGALRFRDAHFDLVRSGIALYGAHPCRDLAPGFDLRPVMTWRARVTALKKVAKGQSVSYGATWTAPRASQIAVLPAGYADGYLRALSNCGEVLLNGKCAPVVGRVTMDQIMVDVTDIPTQIGDEVTLFGANLSVEEVAARAGTISYELLCAVSSRVPRIHFGSAECGIRSAE